MALPRRAGVRRLWRARHRGAGLDHIERGTKRLEIYWLVQSTYVWSTIEAEIAKCAVRCANCHRGRTAAQFAWTTPSRSRAVQVTRIARARLKRPALTAANVDPQDIVADGQLWCESCGQCKPFGDFGSSNKTRCALRFRTYRREHHRLNRDAYIERNNRVLRERRQWWSRRVWGYLADHPCVDCGAHDPRVLEFDHRLPEERVESISLLVHRGGKWGTIEAEIAKCDVRRANCHRRRTAAQFNWPKRLIRQSIAARVDLDGLEPTTPAMRMQCSPS